MFNLLRPTASGDPLLPTINIERSSTSESDVCRRQIMAYKDGSRTEKIIIFLMAVDSQNKRNELTKTFMMIFKIKNNMIHTKIIQRFKG